MELEERLRHAIGVLEDNLSRDDIMYQNTTRLIGMIDGLKLAISYLEQQKPLGEGA